MQRLSEPRPLARLPVLFVGFFSLAVSALGWCAAPPIGGPLVQLIDADEREDHTNVSIVFACTVHYISNTPIDHGTGTTFTLRLGPDCGSLLNVVPPELPLVAGGGQLVTGARVDSVVPGEVTLELSWSRELDFVMAPSASGQGLRLRLLGTSRRKASGGGYITTDEAPEGYSVNLASSYEPFDAAAVQAAAAALKTQAYVSETDIEDKHWYRLRVGPFTTRKEAERVLQIAQSSYPKAWLAINDEATDLTAVARAGAATSVETTPTDPPLPDSERAGLLEEARTALAQRQYPHAIELLTRLQRQSEFPGRAEAQELLGLARERSGQLAHAKAEYEEYLRRYPDGPAAARVRSRLAALAAAALNAKSTGEWGGGAAADHWTMAGSGALTYEYGQDQITTAGTSTSTQSLNDFLVYGDLLLRDRGDRFEFTARVDAGYTANLVKNVGGNQDRTTVAYVELSDRHTGLTGRIGRQSLASESVIGLFDGLYVGYQATSKLMVSAAAGFPAYTSYSDFSSQQKFGTVTAEYGPIRGVWVFDGYLFDEVDSGATDRRAVGAQVRYSEPGRSAVGLVDYDIYFQQLDAATLIGNLKVGKHWILGFDFDSRRSPLLLLSNALIGQSAPDLTTLETEFTPSQIKQLAEDRTAISDTYVLSATRPIGERWQFIGNVSALKLSGTPASGGVTATTSTGLDKNVSVQMSGASLLQASDLNIFGVRYDNSPSQRSITLSWDARFVLPRAWRIGPRFSVEQLDNPTLGGTQWLYLPEMRTDWTGKKSVFELIGGYQVQQQQPLSGQGPSSAQDERHLYVS
ncbi:MAG TPA: SPOR domain-containing protein, partial [Steroidobacteraceae bacterium]